MGEIARLAGRAREELVGPASSFDPRVGALNIYRSRGRMHWHVDDYNFAKKERPIVMASLGATADVGYKMRKLDPDQIVRLESGDAMLGVHADTGPAELHVPSFCPAEWKDEWESSLSSRSRS